MPYSGADAGMPSFLFIATVANFVFIGGSVRDCTSKKSPVSKPTAVSLLLTAVAESIWVLPCFIQCVLVFFKGHGGDWAPDLNSEGCDIQGYYSFAGSLAAMLASLLMAVVTLRLTRSNEPPPLKTVLGLCAAVLATALFIGAFPLMHIGRFAYLGEGFCYADFNDTGTIILMMITIIPTVITVLALHTKLYLEGAWPKKITLLMSFAFLTAWILWIPAFFIGLAGASFPKGYFISGAILGHAQALVNPILYGIFWRASAIQMDRSRQQVALTSKSDDENERGAP